MDSAQARTVTVPPPSGRWQGVADFVAVDGEFEQGAAAEVGAAGGHVAAPGVVVEVLALGQTNVGAVEANGNVGGHFVGAAGKRGAGSRR